MYSYETEVAKVSLSVNAMWGKKEKYIETGKEKEGVGTILAFSCLWISSAASCIFLSR